MSCKHEHHTDDEISTISKLIIAPQKCSCGKMIKAEFSSEYGWNYICENCEINWKA